MQYFDHVFGFVTKWVAFAPTQFLGWVGLIPCLDERVERDGLYAISTPLVVDPSHSLFFFFFFSFSPPSLIFLLLLRRPLAAAPSPTKWCLRPRQPPSTSIIPPPGLPPGRRSSLPRHRSSLPLHRSSLPHVAVVATSRIPTANPCSSPSPSSAP